MAGLLRSVACSGARILGSAERSVQMSDIRYTEYKKKQRGRYSWGALRMEGRKQNFRTVGESEDARRKAKRLAQKLSEPPSLSGGVSGQPPPLQHGSDGDDGNPRPRGERLGPALLISTIDRSVLDASGLVLLGGPPSNCDQWKGSASTGQWRQLLLRARGPP